MSARWTFAPIGPDEVRWHDELPWHPGMADLFWLDGELDTGHTIGVGMLRSRPLVGGQPAITVTLMSPSGDVIGRAQTYEPGAFSADAAGGRWGKSRLAIELDAEGRPRSFELSVSIDGVAIDIACTAICAGRKFTERSPGFSTLDESTGSGAGWWPLIPRAASQGSIAIDGRVIDGSGLWHIERQISSFPLAGDAGQKSAQSVWGWGHFYAEEYTAIWTDSGASEQFGYHHFTPFLLWRGRDLVLATFAFASAVERFEMNPATGLALPVVTTLRASDGTNDFFARLTRPSNFDHVELNDKPGSIYCRQRSDVAARLDTDEGTQRVVGRAVHEWGTQAGNYPFVRQPPSANGSDAPDSR